MYEVKETTFDDLCRQAIAFTDKALALLDTYQPFDDLDIGTQCTAADDNRPFKSVLFILKQYQGDKAREQLLLANGEEAPAIALEEGAMRVSSGQTVAIMLPIFTVATQAFFRRLLARMNPDARLCIYARGWRDRTDEGSLPAFAPDLTGHRWFSAGWDERLRSIDPQLPLAPEQLQYREPGIAANLPVRTFAGDGPVWRMREHMRNHCVYDQLPCEVLNALDPAKVADTFPHLSQKDTNAGLIAYTENGAKGALDRQSVMKPGRFIRQYGYDHLTDEDVKRLAAAVAGMSTITYHHSRKRGDYSRVYQTGPSSCMSYGPLSSRGTFRHTFVDGKFVHPAEVYAHPDNNIELVWGELKGEVISRAVVNTAKKTYVRIYAKENVANSKPRMARYLADQGYEHSEDALNGELLLRLRPDGYPDGSICPYIDPGNVGVDIYNDHLIVGGEEQADHETGCLYCDGPSNKETWECYCCGSEYDEDDEQHFDEGDSPICGHCQDNAYTHAYIMRWGEYRYVHQDSCDLYELVGRGTGNLQYVDYLYTHSPGRYDLVILDSDYYSDACYTPVAESGQTTRLYGGDYVLTDDLDDLGLFYSHEHNDARPIDEWAVLVDESGEELLVERSDIDDDLHQYSHTESSEEYPMLPYYTTIQEDAA